VTEGTAVAQALPAATTAATPASLGAAATPATTAAFAITSTWESGYSVFTTADARQLVDFAQTVHLGWLAFWSGARDRACPGGPQGWAGATCSGIDQQSGEFSRVFAGYQG
jgi:hypothetical protein